MTLIWKHLVYTASFLSVARSTLDKLGIPLRSQSRSTICTSGFVIPEKSEDAEHSINLGHDTSILVKKFRHMDHIIEKANVYWAPSWQYEQEKGSSLSRSRKLLIQTLKEQKKVLSKDKWLTPSWLDLPLLKPFLEHLLLFFCPSLVVVPLCFPLLIPFSGPTFVLLPQSPLLTPLKSLTTGLSRNLHLLCSMLTF